MELSLSTVLSITTGYLHSSCIEIENAISKITGNNYHPIDLIMQGVPMVSKHIINHFPCFIGVKPIIFPTGCLPTIEQLENKRLKLNLPSLTLVIPKIEENEEYNEYRVDEITEEIECIMGPNVEFSIAFI